MIYDVDVKAFLRVQVKADTIEGAIEEAKAFVEGLTPNEYYLDGWNKGRSDDEACAGRQVIETGSFDCEDTSYVEDAESGDVLQESA